MSRLPSAYERAIQGLGLLAGLSIGACAVMISIDVALRNLFHNTIAWLPDVVEHVLFFATFAVAPWVLRQGAHVRVDLLLAALPPAQVVWLDRIANAIGALICIVFGYYGVLATADAVALGSIQYKTLAVPEWCLLIVVPTSMLLLAVEFVLRMVRIPETGHSVDQGF